MKKGVEILTGVSNAMVSNQVWEEILQLTVRIIATTMGYKICCIYLVDEEKDLLVMKAIQSENDTHRELPPLKIGESICGLAVKEKRPIVVSNVREDPRYARPELARDLGLVSMLTVPMMFGGRAIGVLVVDTAEPHTFTGEEITVLQSVANQTALSVEGVLDALTRAYNRRYLDRRVEKMLTDDAGRIVPVGLILLDIDFFKVINDLHGHAFGDMALREVAGCLRRVLRNTDVLIRYGGDEFLLLLPHIDTDGAHTILRKAMYEVAHLTLKDKEDRAVRLSISGGVAASREDGESFDALLEKADERLRKEKLARFNRE